MSAVGRDELLKAQRAGDVLPVIGRLALADEATRADLRIQLVDLHNAGEIDVVDAFARLKNGAGPDFFLTRHVFDQILPTLNAPVPPVMRCCVHLTAEAGQDLAAGFSLSAYGDFLVKNPERAREALREIEADVSASTVLLVSTLIAGSRNEFVFFLDQAIRLSAHVDALVRANALHAIGRLAWTPEAQAPESLLALLGRVAADEPDDRVRSSALKSTALLWTREPSNEARWLPIVRGLLARGGPYTLNAAAELLAYEIEHHPPTLLPLLLDAMQRIAAENAGTIKTLDFALLHLLQRGASEPVLGFLEGFLTADAKGVEMGAFPNTISQLQRDPALTNKLLTRWLSGGQRPLCMAVQAIVSGLHEVSSSLGIDIEELDVHDRLQVVFLARKAVGYLLLKPRHCVAIIVSLMTASADRELCNGLAELMYEVVLVNFSGSGREALERAMESAEPVPKAALAVALQHLDAYMSALPDARAALRPSAAHRETARRRMAELLRKSMRAAEKQSVLFSLFKRSVLLYGRTSIHYVDAPDAPRRVAMPLQQHGTSFEVPRLSVLDPLGLDRVRRVFQAEHRIT